VLRPADAPGIEQDLRVSRELERHPVHAPDRPDVSSRGIRPDEGARLVRVGEQRQRRQQLEARGARREERVERGDNGG
jgi:hypothetical protein